MAALRCSVCAFNYPEHYNSSHCPICEEPLSYMDKIEPSEGWEEIVFQGKKEIVHVSIMQLDEPYPPWLFVSHDDLLALGYSALEDFDVVAINGTKYELQGYLHEANCWWIEEVVEADEVDKLRSDLDGWSETPPPEGA